MAARRHPGQSMGTPLLAGSLLVAAIVLAAPAQADSTTFLKDVHSVGIHDVDGGDQALVVTGWKICAQLSAGSTPQQLAEFALQSSDSQLGNKGLTPQQAVALIADAQQDLCPNG